jgi:hypothetical protein
MCTRSGVN